MRETLRFRCQIKGVGWLGPDPGSFVEEKDALEFEFYRSSTPGEEARIEQLEHDTLGFTAWMELEDALSTVRRDLHARAVDLVWPDGRPEAKTDAELREQDDAIEKAWTTLPEGLRRGLSRLGDLAERVRFGAMWEVLQAKPLPEGWRQIRNNDQVDAAHLDALRMAWFVALTGEAGKGALEGKPPPSE